MTVSSASILCMAVSALLSIGVPVGLLIYFRKKYKAKMVPALVGAAAFVVFAMVLEQGLHALVLKPQADRSTWLSSYPILYMLYGCFAAGIFEETGRFLSFKLLKRRYGGIGTGLSYGVGHGGIEAILLGGIAMVNALVLSVVANSGNLAQLTSGPNGALVTAQIQSLASTAPAMFLVSGVERMFALTIHIALSVIVFYSVYENRRLWLYPAAILLHALIDAPAALTQVGVLTNVLWTEALIFLCAVAVALIAVYTHRKLKPSDAEIPGDPPSAEPGGEGA
jgi:uncharacterized membrane protein YhfC